jgi:acetyl esterase/lipase
MSVPAQPQVIPLWPRGAPDSPGPDWSERESVIFDGTRVVRNVARPTVTGYLPDPATATGIGVVVCPGGAFHFLVAEREGTDVARWLVGRGVAAFVLRYRVLRTPEDDEAFRTRLRENLASRERMLEVTAPALRLAIADGQQAVRVVRQRAADWGVDPNRVGMMGFSAGGAVTTGATLQNEPTSRPAFAALIYGAPFENVAVPADAPPLFLALGGDDQMAVDTSLSLYGKWRDAGRSVELHIFGRGGHGFGMRQQGLPSDRWIDLFGEWLGSLGLFRGAR